MTESTPSSAASSYTPVVTDAMRLVRVLFSPGEVFKEQEERPTFWIPWLLVSIAYVVVAFLMRPFQERLRGIMIEQSGRPAPAGAGGTVAAVISAVFTPVGLLLVMLLFTAILYGLTSAMGGETTFKKMRTVVVFTWPIVIIQQLLTYIVLSMRGVDSIHGMSDIFVSLGADLLLPSDANVGLFVRLLLAGIGPLQIWMMAITATGVHIMGKTSKGTGWAVAVINFLIGLVFTAGIGSFFAGMMGGR